MHTGKMLDLKKKMKKTPEIGALLELKVLLKKAGKGGWLGGATRKMNSGCVNESFVCMCLRVYVCVLRAQAHACMFVRVFWCVCRYDIKPTSCV